MMLATDSKPNTKPLPFDPSSPTTSTETLPRRSNPSSIQKLKEYRMVEEGEGGTLYFSDPYCPELPQALGTEGCLTCVGVYFQLDPSRCFLAHIFPYDLIHPSFDLQSRRRLRETVIERLRYESTQNGWPDPPTNLMRKTLVLCCPFPAKVEKIRKVNPSLWKEIIQRERTLEECGNDDDNSSGANDANQTRMELGVPSYARSTVASRNKSRTLKGSNPSNSVNDHLSHIGGTQQCKLSDTAIMEHAQQSGKAIMQGICDFLFGNLLFRSASPMSYASSCSSSTENDIWRKFHRPRTHGFVVPGPGQGPRFLYLKQLQVNNQSRNSDLLKDNPLWNPNLLHADQWMDLRPGNGWESIHTYSGKT